MIEGLIPVFLPPVGSRIRCELPVILIVSAIITPSTDPINMGVVAIPLLLLYEGGILVAHVFASKPLEPVVGGGRKSA